MFVRQEACWAGAQQENGRGSSGQWTLWALPSPVHSVSAGMAESQLEVRNPEGLRTNDKTALEV